PPASPLPTTMMSNFRLLLGLTSLDSTRCFSHFFSSGPEGVFESIAIVINPLSDKAEKHEDRDHRKSRENQPSQNCSPFGYGFGQFAIVDAKRLRDAGDSMAEVSAEKKDPQYIEEGNQRLLESKNH